MSAKRIDIEALRGIAVLSVFAYHLNSAWLPNGLLGVDVFFVISGYVITGSLASRTGPFLPSLLGFYARRVKRILPALVFCIVISCVLAFNLFVDHFDSLVTGIYALLAVANFQLFFNATEYFSRPAELNAFTHTWSLGIEEQYYLFYPALFLLLSRHLVSVLVTLSLASAWLFFTAEDTFAFYMLPARFWELGAGCLLYVLAIRKPDTVLWFISISLIFVALILPLDLRIATAVAVVATAAAIATYQHVHFGPLVFVGTISYSLYLWHWPIIVTARQTVGVDQSTVLPIIGLTFAFACFSYFIIERPLRNRSWGSHPKTLGFALIGTVAAAGFVAFLNQSVWRHTINDRVYSQRGHGFSISGMDCHMPQTENPVLDCLLPSEKNTVFVLGDSHARSLIPAIHQAFPDHELRYLTDKALVFDMLGMDGCGGSRCAADEIGARTDFLRAWGKPGDILMFSMSRDTLYDSDRIGDRTPALTETLNRNLERFVADLEGLRVILVEDIPKLCTNTEFTRAMSDHEACTIPETTSLEDRAPLSAVLQSVARKHRAEWLDPHPRLCDAGTCSVYLDGELLYTDASPHLTLKASLRLASMFQE